MLLLGLSSNHGIPMKTRITKTSADRLEAVERDSYLWDDKTTGFGLKVTPKGRKVFIASIGKVGARAERGA